MAQLSGGSVAQIWPARWLPGRRPDDAVDPLLAALLADLPRQGVSFAQSLLPSTDDPDAQALLKAGFLHAADLTYLSAEVQEFKRPAKLPHVEFQPYESSQRNTFAALVEQTYEGSLDCPLLNGLRPTDEVLDEYAQVGAEGTRLWFRARRRGATSAVCCWRITRRRIKLNLCTWRYCLKRAVSV
ncbi:MAG: hypothetical protein QM775_30520 [Pirellulales bacterium]